MLAFFWNKITLKATSSYLYAHTAWAGRQSCSDSTKGPAVWEETAKIASWQHFHHSQNTWLLLFPLVSLKDFQHWTKKLQLQKNMPLSGFSPLMPPMVTCFECVNVITDSSVSYLSSHFSTLLPPFFLTIVHISWFLSHMDSFGRSGWSRLPPPIGEFFLPLAFCSKSELVILQNVTAFQSSHNHNKNASSLYQRALMSCRGVRPQRSALWLSAQINLCPDAQTLRQYKVTQGEASWEKLVFSLRADQAWADSRDTLWLWHTGKV